MVEVWALLALLSVDLDHDHCSEANGTNLNDPFVAHHDNREDESKLARHLGSREVDCDFALRVLIPSDGASVVGSPRPSEAFVQSEPIVVNEVEDGKHKRQNCQE